MLHATNAPDPHAMGAERPPFPGTWRRVYTAVMVYLALPIALSMLSLARSHEPLDWVVLVGSLASIIAYGLYRGRYGPVHHGQAGQRQEVENRSLRLHKN